MGDQVRLQAMRAALIRLSEAQPDASDGELIVALEVKLERLEKEKDGLCAALAGAGVDPALVALMATAPRSLYRSPDRAKR